MSVRKDPCDCKPQRKDLSLKVHILLWYAGPALLAASAIRGWSLLLTSLPGWRLDSTFCDGALGFLSQKLADSDVELRSAAGEAVALLFSLAGLGELDPGIAGGSCGKKQYDSDNVEGLISPHGKLGDCSGLRDTLHERFFKQH